MSENGHTDRRFEIAEIPERHAAAIRELVPLSDTQTFLSHALPELWTEVRDQKRRPLAAPYVRYHGVDGDRLDLEAGIMIGNPSDPRGRVKPVTLPGGEAAMTWHEGRYETLGSTRSALQDWLVERELRPASPHWEIYWTNAGSTDDVSRWRTQLVWPVLSAPAEGSEGR